MLKKGNQISTVFSNYWYHSPASALYFDIFKILDSHILNLYMKKLLLLLIFLISTLTFSQKPLQGKVISDYGKTFPVESPDFKTDTTSTLKVVFDVDRSFDEAEPNKLIETAARYLNMHENAGVDPDNMNIALVLHGKAVQDALKDKYYTNRFPDVSENPILPLIEALVEQGAEVITCGQSATYYKVNRNNTDENSKFALSAMTALVQLQNDNYRLIKF